MSHWHKGKLDLKCGFSLLHQVLAKLRPDWIKHIKTDENGKLSIYNTYTNETKSGYSIVIPGGKNSDETGLPFADIGFKQNKDGAWEMEADFGSIEGSENLKGQIIQEVAYAQQKALALQKGYQVLEEKDESGKKTLVLRVPVKEKHLN